MKMYFDSDRAFEYLNQYGSVFSYRVKFNMNPQPILLEVQLWRNRQDLKVSAKRLKISEGLGTLALLEYYLPWSGFKTVDEWRAEILRLSGPKANAFERGVLYYVHEVRGEPALSGGSSAN